MKLTAIALDELKDKDPNFIIKILQNYYQYCRPDEDPQAIEVIQEISSILNVKND